MRSFFNSTLQLVYRLIIRFSFVLIKRQLSVVVVAAYLSVPPSNSIVLSGKCPGLSRLHKDSKRKYIMDLATQNYMNLFLPS